MYLLLFFPALSLTRMMKSLQAGVRSTGTPAGLLPVATSGKPSPVNEDKDKGQGQQGQKQKRQRQRKEKVKQKTTAWVGQKQHLRRAGRGGRAAAAEG